jgi:predicted porin
MRILVTILAVLLASQASAQTENKVTVSGRAWGSFENVEAGSTPTGVAPVRNRYRVTNDSSYVRIRGDMKVSDDLTAWGQLESQFALDGVGLPIDSGRNTGVGFTSKSLGTITIGRWDSPYKLAVIRLDPWGNTTINNYSAIMGAFHNSGGSLYDARLGNGVQYWTPVISGFQVRAAAIVNEDRTNAISPHVVSLSATYDGPIYIGAAYETRRNCTGANGQGFSLTATPAATNIICAGPQLAGAASGRDWGVRVGAGINLKPTNTEVGVIFEHLEASGGFATGVAERDLKRDAYYASVVQGLGTPANQVVAAVGMAAKSSGNFLASNDNTKALYWTAALRHNFNKDLMVYGAYVRIDNNDAAGYRFGSSGLVGAAGNPVGATYQGWSVGTRYLF